VSIGIVWATLSSNSSWSYDTGSSFLFGIFLLVFGAIVGGILGIYQQITFSKYSCHWTQSLFYIHLYSLPLFAIFWKDIMPQFKVFHSSAPVDLSWIPFLNLKSIPYLWFQLILNMATQSNLE
jgi:UDP-xylose/UDP-N-acetylglucosamine transporter B4